MQPGSSLIFLVIIAIWAAYFIQHWVRRREHLLTARSVDQFSESMRVLERRSPLAEAELSLPRPRSYAVSPARAARPEVLVKRASPVGRAPVEGAPPRHRTGDTAVAGPRSRRRLRGIVVLGALVGLLAGAALASFAVVSWLVTLAPATAVAGVLVWSRRAAQAERAARRAASSVRARQPSPERRQAPVAVERPAAEPGPVTEPPTVEARHDGLYDIEAVEAVGAVPAAAPTATRLAEPRPAVPLVDEDDIPLTWDPVPVPRPTYTMKAMAQRPAPAPVGAGVPPELAEPAYEEPVRRVAGA